MHVNVLYVAQVPAPARGAAAVVSFSSDASKVSSCMANPLSDEQLALLRSDQCLTITVAGATLSGFVRAVGVDHVEFDAITNPGRYFSNYSDPPEFSLKRILFADLLAVKKV